MKICNTCGIEKDDSEFSIHMIGKKWLRGQCKKCRKNYLKSWHEKKPEKSYQYSKNWREKNPEKYTNFQLKRDYNITLKQKELLIQKQNGKCVICEKEFKNTKDAHVDHNHITKKIRGILCKKCNHALGLFNCDISTNNLINAIQYLNKNIE